MQSLMRSAMRFAGKSNIQRGFMADAFKDRENAVENEYFKRQDSKRPT